MKKSLKVFVAVLILASFILAGCNQAPVTNVPAIATIVPATATIAAATTTPVPPTSMPVPKLPGKLIFWGAYDNMPMHMLDLTSGMTATTNIPFDGAHDEVVGQENGKVIVAHITGELGTISFFAYSPETGITTEIATPFEIRIWDTSNLGSVVDWKIGPDGKLYFMFRKDDGDYNISVYGYRLDDTTFVPVNKVAFKLQKGMSFQASSRQYKADLSKIIQTGGYDTAYSINDTVTGKIIPLNLIGKQQWDVGYSPDEKSIVYVAYMGGEASKGDANLCIVLVDANNLSSQKAVYCNTGAGYDFSDWSPDGHYIAITNWYSPDKNNPSSNIIMLDMQTFKATEPVLVGQLTRSPTWSPDSKSLAFFVITKENAPAFYVIGADGTGLSKLYSGPEWQKVWDDAQVKGGMYPYWIQAWVN